MKKVTIVLLAGLICLLGTAALAYNEAPMLKALVDAGKLPPLEERLPIEPFVAGPGALIAEENLDLEIGQYGGTLRLVSPGASIVWCVDVYLGSIESLLGGRGISVEGIRGTILSNF